MLHSCSPAASVAEAEGGGKSRRRGRPARNCIVSFSYLFRIPTACHLFADHFPRPTRSKSPKRSTAQGQGWHFTATRYVQLPWAIHHNRNLSGFPWIATKIRFFVVVLPQKQLHWMKMKQANTWKLQTNQMDICISNPAFKNYTVKQHIVRLSFTFRMSGMLWACWRKPYQRALSSSGAVSIWGALGWPYHLITSCPSLSSARCTFNPCSIQTKGHHLSPFKMPISMNVWSARKMQMTM